MVMMVNLNYCSCAVHPNIALYSLLPCLTLSLNPLFSFLVLGVGAEGAALLSANQRPLRKSSV